MRTGSSGSAFPAHQSCRSASTHVAVHVHHKLQSAIYRWGCPWDWNGWIISTFVIWRNFLGSNELDSNLEERPRWRWLWHSHENYFLQITLHYYGDSCGILRYWAKFSPLWFIHSWILTLVWCKLLKKRGFKRLNLLDTTLVDYVIYRLHHVPRNHQIEPNNVLRSCFTHVDDENSSFHSNG